MQHIVPFLWFESKAEEAVNFYVSTFKRSEILSVSHYGKGSGMPEGSVMSMVFKLDGQEFHALNGGAHQNYNFTPAISFFVKCDTQEEIDRLWQKLSEGGQEQMCGWLVDRFGISWQIIPPLLGELLNDKDPKKSERVMKAMLKMRKIDIATLKQAQNDSN